MADFAVAFQNTMDFEDKTRSGRVTAEPSGCRTRFGINEHAHPHMPAEFWTGSAINAMSLAEALCLAEYWRPLKLGNVLNQAVANKIFDMGINMGPAQAVCLVQRAVLALGVKITLDGLIGQNTLDAINSLAPGDLLNELRILSVAYYQHVEAVHPADVRWDGGWMTRARA